MKLTEEQACIVMGYTKVTCLPIDVFIADVSKRLGRPATHLDLIRGDMIQNLYVKDFLEMMPTAEMTPAERFVSDSQVRVVGVPPALGAGYGLPEDKIAADLTPAHYQPEVQVKWTHSSQGPRCADTAGVEHEAYRCVYVAGHDGNHMIGYDDEDES